jgi:hypothetical protein
VQTSSSTRSPIAAEGFLAALGWGFAVLSGLGAAIALLQVAVLFVVGPTFARADPIRSLPVWGLRGIAFAGFGGSLLTLVASIGILRRREWARTLMMLLLACAALGTVVRLVSNLFQPTSAISGAGGPLMLLHQESRATVT